MTLRFKVLRAVALSMLASGCAPAFQSTGVPTANHATAAARVTGPAKSQRFALFDAPTDPDSYSDNLAVAADGAFWYANYRGPNLVRFQADGTWERVKIPPFRGTKILPNDVVSGPDGRLWFASRNDAGVIGAVDGNYSVTEYQPLGPGYVITLGSSVGDDIWFSAGAFGSGEDRVGYIDAATGRTTSFQLSNEGVGGNQIVLGSDGNLWFPYDYSVGRVTPKGKITLFPTSPEIEAVYIVAGPDKNLWISGFTSSIERMRTDGTIAGTQTFDGVGDVGHMVVGPDGHVWFTAHYNIFHHSYLVRVDGTKRFTSYRVPNGGSYAPDGIVSGPDGRLWFDTYGTKVPPQRHQGMGAFTLPNSR